MFQAKLQQLKELGRFRSLNLPQGIDFSSNDYLGMASHPELRRVAIEALEGGIDIGAGGSRLLRGHTDAHAELEAYAAEHFDAPAALYFGSGFMANYGLLTTLPARGDVVLYDALVHASMRDGIKAMDAKGFKFAHNDLDALEDLLKRTRDQADQIWITVESVYSMDGDFSPLLELHELAEKYDAFLIVDEAHGTGVFGAQGKGAAYDLVQKYGYDRMILVHTCGKAIGAAGGLVCASADVISYLINASRPFIYATATIPIQSVIVKKSLEILSSSDGDARREKLFSLMKRAQGIFGGAGSQIIPIMIGDDEKAVLIAEEFQKNGFDLRAIRPPTVPVGSARLRLSLSSEVDSQDFKTFCDFYETKIAEMKLDAA